MLFQICHVHMTFIIPEHRSRNFPISNVIGVAKNDSLQQRTLQNPPRHRRTAHRLVTSSSLFIPTTFAVGRSSFPVCQCLIKLEATGCYTVAGLVLDFSAKICEIFLFFSCVLLSTQLYFLDYALLEFLSCFVGVAISKTGS